MPDRQASLAASPGRAADLGAAIRGHGRRLLRAETIVLAVCALAVCAFYFWTAYSGGAGSGYYAALSDAFEHGQTSLRTPPPPELLALDDPYDPVQNQPYRLHDASLYEGRWYLYFGPSPVVVYIPLRAVGIDVSDEFASAFFASAGFLFALALMRFLILRYRPRTSLATRAVAVVLLGLANVAPFLLRRPAVYEVAIAAGFCFLLAALYLTLTGALRAQPSLARLAGGSAALGLAAGARPHLLLALPILAWAWWRALRERGGLRAPRGRLLRLAAAIAVPVGVCLVLLAVYNVVRFGSVTEFGQTYQLGGIKTSTLDRFDVGRLVPGVFFYLLAPPSVDLLFPFAHLTPTYPGTLAPEYAAGLELVAGALATTPLLVLAFAAPALLARERGRREDMVVGSLLLLVAVLVMAVPLLTFNGATMRYEVDYVTLLMLAALLVWLRVEEALPGRRLVGAAVRAVAGLAALVAVVFGLAFSMTGYGDTFRLYNPESYARIEGAFDWVPTLAARLRGEPVVLEVGPPAPAPVTAVRLAAPGAGVVELRLTYRVNPALPPGTRIALAVEGSDGVIRRYPRVVPEPMIVRAGLRSSGVQHVSIRAVLPRFAGPAPAPPPGFAADVGVAGWAGR